MYLFYRFQCQHTNSANWSLYVSYVIYTNRENLNPDVNMQILLIGPNLLRTKIANHSKLKTTQQIKVYRPGKPWVFLVRGLVLQQEVSLTPCKEQRDTSLVHQKWISEQESPCFLQTRSVQRVAKGVQVLSETPPCWIERFWGPVPRKNITRISEQGGEGGERGVNE